MTTAPRATAQARRFTYLRNAATTTAVTVVPSSRAFATASSHRSGGIRSDRGIVLPTSGHLGREAAALNLGGDDARLSGDQGAGREGQQVGVTEALHVGGHGVHGSDVHLVEGVTQGDGVLAGHLGHRLDGARVGRPRGFDADLVLGQDVDDRDDGGAVGGRVLLDRAGGLAGDVAHVLLRSSVCIYTLARRVSTRNPLRQETSTDHCDRCPYAGCPDCRYAGGTDPRKEDD